ncbi:MAG: PepSY domain-containing protein [Planctomycetes bacterium]|nr:PepSY domain-containing protein [Planctomycetota bacterium]
MNQPIASTRAATSPSDLRNETPSAPSRVALRRAWLTVHRWLGLTVGLLFVLLGLTGSLLVFDHAIDEWLNPNLLLTEGVGPRRPLAEAVAAAEAAYRGEPKQAAALSSPRVENGVWIVWFQGGTEEEPVFSQVYVDPYTAKVIGQRVWGEDLMSWIYKLHYTLHGGDFGETLVGVGGLIFMLSIGSGVYLWWPLWKNGWRAAFAVRRGSRFNYDLHKTLGVLSAAILLVIAFTGVYMIFPEWVKPMVTALSEETLPPTDLESSGRPGRAPLTPEQAIAIGQKVYPDATFCHFHPPQGEDGVYEVAFRQPGEVQRSFGRTQLWIDARTGDIVAVRRPQDFTAADTFIAWQFPLHNGEAFGLIGRWIVFFTGFVPAILYTTGFLLWRRRRRSRRRQQRSVPHNRQYLAPNTDADARGAAVLSR